MKTLIDLLKDFLKGRISEEVFIKELESFQNINHTSRCEITTETIRNLLLISHTKFLIGAILTLIEKSLQENPGIKKDLLSIVDIIEIKIDWVLTVYVISKDVINKEFPIMVKELNLN